jgi:hypothetical protein
MQKIRYLFVTIAMVAAGAAACADTPTDVIGVDVGPRFGNGATLDTGNVIASGDTTTTAVFLTSEGDDTAVQDTAARGNGGTFGSGN